MKTSNLYCDAYTVFLPAMKENPDYSPSENDDYSPCDQRTGRLSFLRDVRRFIPFQQRLYMIQLARETYNEYFTV